MRKRIYFSPDGSPPELPWLSTYCAEPEMYESLELVPDEAWDKYEAARLQYVEALKELDKVVTPPESLNDEEIHALKEEFLSITKDFDESTSISWRRDLGHSVLAPKVYGEDFVKEYGLSWDDYREIRDRNKGETDEDLFTSRLEVPSTYMAFALGLIKGGCSSWPELCIHWPYRENGDYSSLRLALENLKDDGLITTDSAGFTDIKAVGDDL